MMKVKILLMLLVMNLPILLKAQPPTFDDESPEFGVKDVPFDDNVWLLVVVAVFYGGFRIMTYKKNAQRT